MITRPRNSINRGGVLIVAALTLCAGCTPISTSTLESFVSDMLLSMVAAFLF